VERVHDKSSDLAHAAMRDERDEAGAQQPPPPTPTHPPTPTQAHTNTHASTLTAVDLLEVLVGLVLNIWREGRWEPQHRDDLAQAGRDAWGMKGWAAGKRAIRHGYSVKSMASVVNNTSPTKGQHRVPRHPLYCHPAHLRQLREHLQG
jgi:hypothetical protein